MVSYIFTFLSGMAIGSLVGVMLLVLMLLALVSYHDDGSDDGEY